MDETILFTPINTYGSNTTNTISPVDITAGTLGAFGAGLLLVLWILPLPLITQLKYIRKKTLWEFENVWLPLCTIAFFVSPIIFFFSVVPILKLQAYTNSEFFKIIEWIPGIALICIWCTLGLTCYALAVDYIGLIPTNAIVLPICVMICMLIKILRFYPNSYLRLEVFQSGQSVMLWVTFALSLNAAVLAIIGSIFKEKSTRDTRIELSINVERDIANLNKGKAAKEKKEKAVSPVKVIIRYYIGLCAAVVAACSFYLLPLGFALSEQLFYSMQRSGISQFQSHTALLSLGMFIGYIPSFLIAFGLLLVNKTIKKYAICSGGVVALTGVNFKKWRLICLLISVLMGFCLSGSLFLQWCISDAYMGGFGGDFDHNYGVWNVGVGYLTFAIFASLLAIIPLFEFRKTKWPERVTLLAACVVGLVAISGSLYYAYPTKWHTFK